MNKVLDNSQRAKSILIIYYILGCGYLALLVSTYMQYQMLQGNIFTIIAEADSNDKRQLGISMFNVLVIIIAIVFFIMWFRRAYHNLHKAGVKGLVTTEGWAAGAWFVPFLNFFRPYQIMQEIWSQTRNYVKSHGGDNDFDNQLSTKTNSNTILGFWWATWIISGVVSNISSQMIKNSPTLDQIKNASLVQMLGILLSIVSLVLIIIIIRESQKDQNIFYNVWKNQKDNTGSFNLTDDEEILI
ncbi:MAG: DUF4328 domain-containing protein [Crocinitomicaceae bacterium]|nr:DUF4328 domain-containing protein [Crocinitomicaceae bacterium]